MYACQCRYVDFRSKEKFSSTLSLEDILIYMLPPEWIKKGNMILIIVKKFNVSVNNPHKFAIHIYILG